MRRVLLLIVAMLTLAAGRAEAVESGTTGVPDTMPGDALEREGEPMRISMDFKDADLKNVLKTFSQQTGLNVIASDEVEDRTVTLYFEEVTVMDALDRILDAASLTYERAPTSQIYVVRPKPKRDEKAEVVETLTRVYKLKFATVSSARLARAKEALGQQTPFEAAKATAALSASTGGGGGGGGGGGAGAGGAAGGGGGKEIGIDKVIAELLTEQGKVIVDERTNSLIVTDVPENFPRIEAVLKTLDIKTAQVLIEAEILETSMSKLEDLGIEWGGPGGSFVTLTPGSRSTAFPFHWLGHLSPSTGGAFGQSTLTFASATGVLNALEQATDTKILARPKVLTLDNESAMIRLTTSQAVGFKSTSQATTGTTTAEAERFDTGVVLSVTPQVNEGGFITLLVEPSVTKVSTSALEPPSSLGSAVFDPKTRSARAVVRIRDGETLVMGGLIDRTEEETIRKVPILSSIPILGEVFKDRERPSTNQASELFVFITPRIFDDAQEARLASTLTPFPLGPREQRPAKAQADTIEERLNVLEREQQR